MLRMRLSAGMMAAKVMSTMNCAASARVWRSLPVLQESTGLHPNVFSRIGGSRLSLAGAEQS